MKVSCLLVLALCLASTHASLFTSSLREYQSKRCDNLQQDNILSCFEIYKKTVLTEQRPQLDILDVGDMNDQRFDIALDSSRGLVTVLVPYLQVAGSLLCTKGFQGDVDKLQEILELGRDIYWLLTSKLEAAWELPTLDAKVLKRIPKLLQLIQALQPCKDKYGFRPLAAPEEDCLEYCEDEERNFHRESPIPPVASQERLASSLYGTLSTRSDTESSGSDSDALPPQDQAEPLSDNETLEPNDDDFVSIPLSRDSDSTPNPVFGLVSSLWNSGFSWYSGQEETSEDE